jgi:hypothetical protein
MADEMIFTVHDSDAKPARRITLAAAGLRERQHLQEWVLEHPDMLGVDAKIVTFEFDRWMAVDGGAAADRLDVLAVDRTGKLIVAELKRDRAPDTVTMQAINYAAMVSRFSLDTWAHIGGTVTASEARVRLQEWAPEISDESLAPPRIVILASDFAPSVTNAALFLFGYGLDIRLRRYQLYETENGQRVLSVSQLLPVPDAEDFMIKPRSSAPTQAETRARRERRATVAERLVASGLFTDGHPLMITVPLGVPEDRDVISEWLEANQSRATVQWRQDSQYPVVWAIDGQAYNLATLIRRIVTEATGEPPRTQIIGPNWYRDSDGRTLNQIADSIP